MVSLQTRSKLPKDVLVFDTLYREGLGCRRGKPVIVLLRRLANSLKCEPSSRAGETRLLRQVIRQRFCRWCSEPYEGRSATFPEIRIHAAGHLQPDMSEKLVFLVEIILRPEDAKRLHPGQPVDAGFNCEV